jgi:hypothetical protein
MGLGLLKISTSILAKVTQVSDVAHYLKIHQTIFSIDVDALLVADFL